MRGTAPGQAAGCPGAAGGGSRTAAYGRLGGAPHAGIGALGDADGGEDERDDDLVAGQVGRARARSVQVRLGRGAKIGGAAGRGGRLAARAAHRGRLAARLLQKRGAAGRARHDYCSRRVKAHRRASCAARVGHGQDAAAADRRAHAGLRIRSRHAYDAVGRHSPGDGRARRQDDGRIERVQYDGAVCRQRQPA